MEPRGVFHEPTFINNPPTAVRATLINTVKEIIEHEPPHIVKKGDKTATLKNSRKTAVFTFGRFNPPHIGHLRLFEIVHDVAKQLDADYYVVPSSTAYNTMVGEPATKKIKYPLDVDIKLRFLYDLYPPLRDDDTLIDLAKNVYPPSVDPTKSAPRGWSAFDVLNKLIEVGYEKVIFIVGAEDGNAIPLTMPSINRIMQLRGEKEKRIVFKLRIYHLGNSKTVSGPPFTPYNTSATDIRNIFIEDMDDANRLVAFKNFYKSQVPGKYVGTLTDESLREYHDALKKNIGSLLPSYRAELKKAAEKAAAEEKAAAPISKRQRTAIGGKAKSVRTKAATASLSLS